MGENTPALNADVDGAYREHVDGYVLASHADENE
jgi:hypothetical protein